MTSSSAEIWRLFVGIPLNDELRVELDRYVQELRRQKWADSYRWMRPETWHVTLAFLGARQAGCTDTIQRVLRLVAQDEAPFTVWLAGVGRFPAGGAARIVWCGVLDPRWHVAGLAQRVMTALGASSASEFRPHLTLARLPRGHPTTECAGVRLDPSPKLRLVVDRVNLYRSVPFPGGSRYELLQSQSLVER